MKIISDNDTYLINPNSLAPCRFYGESISFSDAANKAGGTEGLPPSELSNIWIKSKE